MSVFDATQKCAAVVEVGVAVMGTSVVFVVLVGMCLCGFVQAECGEFQYELVVVVK